MFFPSSLLKNLRGINIFYRLCSNKNKPPEVPEPSASFIDVKDRHCNPYLEEPTDPSIESYKDSKKYEKRILRKVLIEKEFEANARSRLTKECKDFISSAPANLKSSTGCSISFNQTDWQTYDFDNFQVQGSETKLTVKDCPNKSPPPPATTQPGADIPPGKGKEEADGSKKSGDGGPLSTKTPPPDRLVRREYPEKVIACLIPVEFWEFFFPKTGVSGFYTFLFTFGTYLVSKEIYVLEHNYYHGLGALFMWIGYIKYIGPPLAKYLDKEIDQYEQQWKDYRAGNQKALEDEVVQELFHQFQADGQLILIEAKRENVALQLEEEFRSRQMQVYEDVKRILDYHVQVEMVKNRIQQKNLVEYVTNEVSKSITPDLQDKLIYYSIESILKELEKSEKNKK